MAATGRDNLSEFEWLRKIAPSYSIRAENVSEEPRAPTFLLTRCFSFRWTRWIARRNSTTRCCDVVVWRDGGSSWLRCTWVSENWNENSWVKNDALVSHVRVRTRMLKKPLVPSVCYIQVNVISESMRNKPNLSVRILLDANRGSRGEVSSRTMLTPLLNAPLSNCRVGNYG